MQLFKSKVLEPYTSEITGKKVYPVKVDIKSGLVGGKPIIFTTGDINTATLSVMLCDDVIKYDTKGKRIVANIVRPEGDKLSVQGKVVKEGFVEFNLGYSGISQVGLFNLDIECVWADNHLTTPIFSYMVTGAINVDEEVQEDIKFPVLTELIQEIDTRLTELVGYREELTTATETNQIQDSRLTKLEYDNKVQYTYLNGLFNENKDGRLTINGEGNTLKLEGSKEGIVEIESVEGNTLVNLISTKSMRSLDGTVEEDNFISLVADGEYKNAFYSGVEKLKPSTKYTIICNVKENTLDSPFLLTSSSPEDAFTDLNVEIPTSQVGVVFRSVTTKSDLSQSVDALRSFVHMSAQEGKIVFQAMLIEGDYTSKPLPSYFEGMLSSFEEHKIKEEDVREGTEIQDNLDKYKCNVKVVDESSEFESNQVIYLNSPLLKGDKIIYKEDGLYHYHNSKLITLTEKENWVFVGNGANKEQPDMKRQSDYSQNGLLCYKYPSLEHQSSSGTGITGYIQGELYPKQNWLYVYDGSSSLEEFKSKLQDEPLTVVYELAEPTYEKILGSKFVVDIPNNATLSVDSIIPCTDIQVSYTGSVPSVYEIEETGINNSLDIEVTQQAVDFLLMSTVSGFSVNKKSKGGSNMGAYFASRILKGALDYREVVAKYPEFKEDIDFILKSEGREDLIK